MQSADSATKPGILIISLDCEGKWGMADHLSDRHQRLLTRENLNTAYGRLLDLFAEYGIKATFAFVGAFVLSKEQLEESGFFADTPAPVREYAAAFFGDFKAGRLDGWLHPELLSKVAARPEHEIASHGYSHVPFDRLSCSATDLQWELQGIRRVGELTRHQLRTLVFPRNIISGLDSCIKMRFAGYRASIDRATSSQLGNKVRNLGRELNMFERSESTNRQHAQEIPAGHFLNWRHGLRAKIPIGLTVRRWQSMLRHGARNGGVVHLWTHPHNFLDGDRQFDLLQGVLSEARPLLRSGALVSMTQLEYVSG